jgi:hypothetical protein
MLKRPALAGAVIALVMAGAGQASALTATSAKVSPSARGHARIAPGAPARSPGYHPRLTGRPAGIVWQHGRTPPAVRPASGGLLYHGGFVQHNPQIYIVLWGTWWYCQGSGCVHPGSGNGADVETYLYNYWHGVGTGNDSLVQVDNQYSDSSGSPTFGNGVWGSNCSADGHCGWVAYQQDPPQAPTVQDLAGVAAWGADYFGVAGNKNAEIIVVSPHGINPDGFPSAGFCAWHSYTTDSAGNFVAYTNMPYLPDAGGGCDASTSHDGWSIVGGHEFSETVTDPMLNAWSDASGNEIGDLCAWINLFHEALPTGSFAQQPLWDNRTGGCRDSVNGTITSYNHPTKCVDDYRSSLVNGTKVDLYSCNGTQAQAWAQFPNNTLRRYGGYGNANTNKCMDITGKKTANGTKIQIWSCTGAWNQQWTYVASKQEWVNPATGKCLDDTGGNLTNGTQLQIWTCNGLSNQKWNRV